jgi:FkbH-like protein
MGGLTAKFFGLAYQQKLEAARTLLRQDAFQQSAVDAVIDAISVPVASPDFAALRQWAAGLPDSASSWYLRARLYTASDPAECARQWDAFFASGAAADPMLFLQAARVNGGLRNFTAAGQLLHAALMRRPPYTFYARSEKLLKTVWEEQPPSMRRCRIAVLGSSTTSLMVSVMRALCFRDGIDAEFYEGLYGAFRQEILDVSSGLHAFRPDVVLIMTHWRDLDLPPLSEAPQALAAAIGAEFEALWNTLGERFGCHVVQHAFDRPAAKPFGYLAQGMPGGRLRVLRLINERLMQDPPAHVSILDTAEVMEEAGLADWEDPYLWHTAKQHPGTEALPYLAELQLAHVRAVLGLTRKVLVCDLDNTLWGGVIGEDGIDGIRIGPGSADGEAYATLHRYLLDLKVRGILLAVCSKNNPEDARLPFEKHAGMGLRLDDFVIFSANWEDKASNLRHIAQKLSLALDSFVFLDDNPLERAWVRSQLPEVAVVEPGPSIHTYVHQLDRGRYFYTLTLSREDSDRVAAYRTQVEAESLRETAPTLEAFLGQLQMRATMVPVLPQNLARVTQLINKTNQFNLTTRRYTEAQVSHVAGDEKNWTGVFQLADRFGGHGIIGVIFCIAAAEPETWEIDIWLMSCRVLGRQMEDFMFDRVVEAATRAGVRRLRGTYHPTGKSVLVADLYTRFGFAPIASPLPDKQYEFTIPGQYRRRSSFIEDASADVVAEVAG